MKRLQFSISGILTIALAVTSAFTIKEDGGIVTCKWFANTTGICNPTVSQLNANGTFLTQCDATGSPHTQMTQEELNNYIANHCVNPTTCICLVAIKYNDGTPVDLLRVINKTYVE